MDLYRYSMIDTYLNCPRRYHYTKLGYKSIVEPACNNALVVGKAMHIALELGWEECERYYKNCFRILTDGHFNELIKLSHMYQKAIKLLDDEYKDNFRITELSFLIEEFFRGTIDLLIDVGNGYYDIIDLKYSNNIDYYLNSSQLHVYKFCIEKYNFKINKIRYLFIGKSKIYQKKTESLFEFRKRLIKNLTDSKALNCKFIDIEYQFSKVTKIFQAIEIIENDTEMCKSESKLCFFCDFFRLCTKGDDFNLNIPKNEIKKTLEITFPNFWIYGDSYSGKTSFVDQFDDVLFINTDGNFDDVIHPVIHVKDEIITAGRVSNKTYAWEKFLELVQQLEVVKTDYKIICLDLVEDLYEHCRIYMYNKLKIEHEHDAGFGKGYDMIRTQFCGTLKKLKNIGYKLVFISKTAKKEVYHRSGQSTTTYSPNLPEKINHILAGMVDITGYIDVVSNNDRYFDFSENKYRFGGTRKQFLTNRVELNKDKFMENINKKQVNTEVVEKARKVVSSK